MKMREFSQLRWLRREIDELRQQMAELETDIMSPASPKAGGMPRGKASRDRMAEYAARIDRVRIVLEDRCLQAAEEQIRLEQLIARVPDSLTRQIMDLHFVRGYSWGRTDRKSVV